jgi:menaquinone-9 beta-reductase
MWDVVIAGAGPAGTVAATILARAGARVLIVDRARFPRDKLCGDSINPGTLALLRRLNLADPVERYGFPLEGMRVCGPSGIQVRAVYPRSLLGRTVMRCELDKWLLDEAIRAGAQFADGVSVRRPLLHTQPRGSGCCVRGIVVSSPVRGEVPLEARVTIAADGRRSALAFALKLASHPHRPRRWAVGAYFESVAGSPMMGEMHIRPGEYVGLAPLPRGLTNICVVGTPDRLAYLDDPLRVLRAAIDGNRALRERFENVRPVTRPVVLGPLAVDTRAAGAPGLLLAGDAAGFVDPMTGDGLRFAVRGAELAAEAALEVLETGRLEAYLTLAKRRRAVFGSKWRFNRALRHVVDSRAAVRLAALGASIAPAYVRMLVAIAGDCSTLNGRSSNGSDRSDVNRSASAHPHAG